VVEERRLSLAGGRTRSHKHAASTSDSAVYNCWTGSFRSMRSFLAPLPPCVAAVDELMIAER